MLCTSLAPSRLCGAVHFTCTSRRLGRKGPTVPSSPGFPAASLSVAVVEFAWAGERGKSLRDTAWAALRAGESADTGVAREATRAAMSAAAAYLHPLARATQVRHILYRRPQTAFEICSEPGWTSIRSFAVGT